MLRIFRVQKHLAISCYFFRSQKSFADDRLGIRIPRKETRLLGLIKSLEEKFGNKGRKQKSFDQKTFLN